MKYTADYLIKKRKEKWKKTHDIEYDIKFREAIANELIENKSLLEEVKKKPEKLIELVFVVVDKNQITMPFFLNDVQRDFIKRINKAKRDYEKGIIPEISILVLKGRQQGFTTVVTAYQLACSIINKNFQGFTLADKSDNSETIFQNKAKFPYNQLPKILQPSEKFNNRKQFLFDKINSSWAVDTATKDVGRSRTINFFHGSECAFWKDGIKPIQAGLGEAFTKNCIKIWESTANGFNDYQIMWKSGNHICLFYEWWKTKEYKLEFTNKQIEDEFKTKIDKGGSWIWDRLKWLKGAKKLKLEQLYWYYNKYQNYIDKDLIKQEYPCSSSEAFLLSGKTVFDTEIIQERLARLKRPLKIGYFTYDYDDEKPRGKKITNIKWVNDRNGYIKIYKMPHSPKRTKYGIGGDTAGEGSDFFTGHVLDAKTHEQVAVLKHKFDSDLFAKQMYCLGKYYRSRRLDGTYEDALIGIEVNYDSYPIRELERLGYDNQYVREKLDEYTGKTEKRFGFRTTQITRPLIVNYLIQFVRENCELINDEDTLDELLTIIKNEKGKVEAPEGGHDDQMMGLSIAHEIVNQITFENEVLTPYPEFKGFNVDFTDMDYGEEITVV